MRLRLCVALSLAAVAGCGGDERASEGVRAPAQDAPVEDPGPIHVHGLGINPRDGALFVATHTGLFRAPEGEPTARRVAERYQDTMGFTVVGPDTFLGSGHPDAREDLPPYLGLIRSTDAGRTWEEVSLMGEMDFHVLEAAGERVYGFGSEYESGAAKFLVSDDGGASWDERAVPASLISLALAPDDPDRVVAATEQGLFGSADGGAGWRPLSEDHVGLLAWAEDAVYLLAGDGTVSRSGDAGRTWEQVGAIGGQPAAFEADGARLYAALHDGTIKQSSQGGERWSIRSRPRATVER